LGSALEVEFQSFVTSLEIHYFTNGLLKWTWSGSSISYVSGKLKQPLELRGDCKDIGVPPELVFVIAILRVEAASPHGRALGESTECGST